MSEPAWIDVSGSGDRPSARSSHAIEAVGNTAYIFGGELEPRYTLIHFRKGKAVATSIERVQNLDFPGFDWKSVRDACICRYFVGFRPIRSYMPGM